MSNFREDIERRLHDARERENKLIRELQFVQKEVMALGTLLHVEEEKHGKSPAKIGVPRIIDPNMSPGEFIMDKMSNGKVWKTSDLRDAALTAGLLHDSTSPGRSTHGALMGLLKGGKVKQAGKSQWVKT